MKPSGSGEESITAAESAVELRPRTNRPSYRETQASKGAKPAHRPTPLLDIAARQEEPCCPSSIPQKLLAILESDTVYSSGYLLRAYMEFEGTDVPYNSMCHLHLQKFVEKIPKTEAPGLSPKVEEGRPMPGATNRRRRASLSDITDCTPFKKPRITDPMSPAGPTTAQEGSPIHDRICDEAYRQ